MGRMSGLWEWLGRVVMLVLAGMITLSIIGAIASIPSGSIETRLGVEGRDWAEAPPIEQTAPQPGFEAAPGPAATREAAPAARGGTGVVAVPEPKPAPTAAEWLEAITYALLALVGLAAIGIVLLWRAVQQWRRSADALEALAARGL
jgi:hypothetical protein